MPLFEYECHTCHNKFEKLVFRTTEKIICPACGSEAVDKLFSTFASNVFAGKSSANCNNGSCTKKHSYG